MDSEEGKKYAAAGGKFAENPKQENGTQQQQAPVQQQQAQSFASAPTSTPIQPVENNVNPYSNGKIELIGRDHTLQAFYSTGWTDEVLVQQGLAKVIVQAPPVNAPAPAPAVPPMAQPVNSQQAFQAENANFNIDDEQDDLPF